MLKFPDKVKIKIVDGLTHQPIKISNIAINIHAFAMQKNDYHLGPFFSNENGEFEISKKMLEVSAEAELQTGLMDYKKIDECSSLVEIRLLSKEDMESLVKARKVWGIIGEEVEIYGSKEDLLSKIEKNNNSQILPQILRVTWDHAVPKQVFYELKTNQKK